IASPILKLRPDGTAAGSLRLWVEVDMSIPFCCYLRQMRHGSWPRTLRSSSVATADLCSKRVRSSENSFLQFTWDCSAVLFGKEDCRFGQSTLRRYRHSAC